MTEEEDIDGLAAEYVLGSLAHAERRDVAARRGGDRALDAAIVGWERRLAALGDLVPEEHPPAHLFEGIARRIWEPASLVSANPPPPSTARRQPPRPWRRMAVAAGALAAVLALVVALALRGPHGTPTTLIAELQRSGQTADEHADGDAKGQPAFRVAVDTALRSIRVTPLAARPLARRSYQLWLLSERAPLPLGIVAPGAATTLPWPAAAGEGAAGEDLAPTAFRNARLAVSLEPEGGSPTGAPSGPILYEGRLHGGTASIGNP